MVTRLALFALLACLPIFGLAASVGAVFGTADGGLRLHLPGPLKPQQTVAVQFMAQDGTVRCCRHVSAQRFVPTESLDTHLDVVSAAPTHNYRLDGTSISKPSRLFAGIAVAYDVSFAARHTSPNRLAAMTDGRKLRATLCTSTEGLHVLHGPLSKPIADVYVPLGYTVEAPSCKPP
jgi:hypothetical protein